MSLPSKHDSLDSGIKISRSDHLSHNLPIYNKKVEVANKGKSKDGSHGHDTDSIKVHRSDGVPLDLVAILKAQNAHNESGVEDLISPLRNCKASKPEAGKRSLSMASIFGSKYSGTPPTSGIAADKAEVLRTYKNLSSGSLGPLPENVFHPTEIRIVHMSNSYNFFSRSSSHAFLPKGDILVHSGDFSLEGTDEDFAQFDGWLKTMKHHYHYRIVVLGLRDVRRYGVDWEVMKALLPHATHVLCHEEVTVMGLRFYGCPWNWGHDVDYSVRSIAPTSTSGRFEDIPPGVHVLVTHGAAFGTLDTKGRDKSIMHLGSRDLAEHVALMRPGLHLHGHVCSARGVSPASKHSASPLVLNSCVCDEEQTVVYATAQVVRCSRLQSEDESSSWVFTLGPLEH